MEQRRTVSADEDGGTGEGADGGGVDYNQQHHGDTFDTIDPNTSLSHLFANIGTPPQSSLNNSNNNNNNNTMHLLSNSNNRQSPQQQQQQLETLLHNVLLERNALRLQNDQLWKICEKQRMIIAQLNMKGKIMREGGGGNLFIIFLIIS